MSAIPRKERISLKSRVEWVKRIRLSKRAALGIGIVLLGVFMVSGAVMLKPGTVSFKYLSKDGAESGNGCIDEERVRSGVMQQTLVYAFGWLGQKLEKDYPCINKVNVTFRPPNGVEIGLLTKDAVLGVQSYQVDINDQATWREAFKLPRGEGELFFVAKDGSTTFFDQGASVSRVIFLREDERVQLTSETIERLTILQSDLEQRDKSIPKLEVLDNRVVKISAVSFEELYLPLDETMEQQLRKAYAVAAFLNLRGTRDVRVDARMRDVVVSPR